MGFSRVNANVFSRPLNDLDSGYACLLMMSGYYGKDLKEEDFLQNVNLSIESNTIIEISRAAEKIGFRARYVNLTFNKLMNEAPLPCIVKWDQYHYAILLPPKRWTIKKQLRCVHPGKGILTYTKEEIQQHWASEVNMDGQPAGGVLILDPSVTFHNDKKNKKDLIDWRTMLQLFLRSRIQSIQLISALLITSLVQLTLPFLLQSIVDVGINIQDLHYITIVLFAQLVLILSRLSCDIIRERLLLHMSSRINLSMIADFWIKLARLPMSYFQRHPTGEILQRINDNKQIQNFVAGPLLNTMFSILNFIVFAVVLVIYNPQLFLIFSIGVALYFTWMRCFLSVRRTLNKELFNSHSSENTTNLQLIQGMQEIKLYNIEQQKRWEWESRLAEIFKANFQQLKYKQLQRTGAIIINQGKDMALTLLVTHLLIQGELTFGAMLAIQYILGQLGGPIEQLIGFVQSAQDAKMSMIRLNEVHQVEEEEKKEKSYLKHLHRYAFFGKAIFNCIRIILTIMFDPGDPLFFYCYADLPIFQQTCRSVMRKASPQNINIILVFFHIK